MIPNSGTSFFGKLLVGIACSCLLLCAVGGYMTFMNIQAGVAAMRPVYACSVEATSLRDALVAYANRNSGKFPSKNSWTSDVKAEFVRRRQELKQLDVKLRDLPADSGVRWSKPEGPWGCQIGTGPFQAYAFNAELADTQISAIKDPQKTVAVFETPNLTNVTEIYKRRGDRTGPSVMGQLRDWIVIPVAGNMQSLVGTGDGSPASR